jgi:hypothetical protein
LNRRRRALLLLCSVSAAACTPAPPQAPVAVDHCELREYLEECAASAATPEEEAACRLRAPKEAIRIAAGIPPECRGPKT